MSNSIDCMLVRSGFSLFSVRLIPKDLLPSEGHFVRWLGGIRRRTAPAMVQATVEHLKRKALLAIDPTKHTG